MLHTDSLEFGAGTTVVELNLASYQLTEIPEAVSDVVSWEVLTL